MTQIYLKLTAAEIVQLCFCTQAFGFDEGPHGERFCRFDAAWSREYLTGSGSGGLVPPKRWVCGIPAGKSLLGKVDLSQGQHESEPVPWRKRGPRSLGRSGRNRPNRGATLRLLPGYQARPGA